MKTLLTALAVASSLALPAWADGYFKGKTMTYIIATNPGGNYDAYARLIGRHLETRLGLDKLVFKNLPGAGHIIGTNTLAAAEPDGLTIGTFNTGLIYAQILQRKNIKFDLRELSWVGKAAADPRVIILSTNSGISSFQELLDTPETVRFSASGIGSASFTETKMLIDGFDLKVDMIPGYNGNEGEMAMLRGEVVGQIGSHGSMKPFVDAGNGVVAVALGGDLQPQAIDFAQSDRAKSIVNLINAMSSLGRLTAAPAGVPEDVLEELRTAYIEVMNDPGFLAEAEKLGLPIEAARGDEVAELVRAALTQTPETVEIIATALEVEVPTNTTKTKIMSMGPKNKVVEFMDGDKTIKAKISGSRTKITLDGQAAEREALMAGMGCEIEYDPNHEEFEPSRMDCTK
ncbi:hypothetical protein BV394_06855 [Brevirhabdus pacifica]|uniref:Uncharacterized protein n=1 Tax=Brevirhabdus pacifica TaxID=1267768 RepID=A0A1U7DHW9_9RHOB|nr:tripartite tricarboxylate transporter substrate-binding protein [Brevirhabdus pacifica]APX89468.1 hypothetical protein BV394_06855 [Brevirhabdus pacifica]OWU76522.1 hypothetical protein ATO5_09445 [Loktanella sp. 22II-4b]PJJ85883.1 tripartite-type tricarboxylate transporter receptor subunit TctC [Brevirhabdus pacifica]